MTFFNKNDRHYERKYKNWCPIYLIKTNYGQHHVWYEDLRKPQIQKRLGL